MPIQQRSRNRQALSNGAPSTATGKGNPASGPAAFLARRQQQAAAANGAVNESPLAALKKLFRKHYCISDHNVIDLVLGIVAGNHFDTDPIWLHLVSPPSAGKTELLMALQKCPAAEFLSSFTANTLISGYRDPPAGKTKASKVKKKQADMMDDGGGKAILPEAEKDYSLLPKLNGKVLITKDFTVIHGMPGEARAQLLAILRDAYDGYASRGLGNADAKGFHSRFNYLTGMTPDIEKLWSLNTLGERFLMCRMVVADRRALARRALDNADSDRGALSVRATVQEAVKEFLAGMPKTKPQTPEPIKELLLDLAEILATCRTYVHRQRNEDLACLPFAEVPARVVKQLLRVGQSVALVRGRTTVTDDEFQLMKRIALDSLPTHRRQLLTALYARKEQYAKLEEFVTKNGGMARTTVRRELKNLAVLGVVSIANEAGTGVAARTGGTDTYRLSETFIRYCTNVGGILAEDATLPQV